MIIEQITKWLKCRLTEAKKRGFILGVSGGIDSTLMVKLLVDANIPHKVAYISDHTVAQCEDISYIRTIDTENILEVDISDIVQAYRKMFETSGITISSSLLVNLRARIRESIFYHLSKINDYLVIGTVNKAEFSLGYFVKNSSIGDVLPLADLSKMKIRELALVVGIPSDIAFRKASGCNGSEYAEQEWGLSEDEVDKFCKCLQESVHVSCPNYEVFQKMYLDSEHKRHYPQVFVSNNYD